MPEDIRFGKPLFDAGEKTTGVQAVDEGVIESARDRDNAVFQLAPGEGGHRRANVILGVSHGAEMQPRQAAGAEEVLAVDDKRRRRGPFRRVNLRRSGSAKGGKIGGVIAPDLAKTFLRGHYRRHHRQLVIFDNLVVQQPLLKLEFQYKTSKKKGNLVAKVRNRPNDTQPLVVTLAENVPLAKNFTYVINLTPGGTLNIKAASGQWSRQISTTWRDKPLYFKAGAYVQDNTGNSAEGGQVTFNKLDIDHNAL